MPPSAVQVSAPMRAARARLRSSGSPCARPAANAPWNASPAPVLSTTRTRGDAKRRTREPASHSPPCAPSVTTGVAPNSSRSRNSVARTPRGSKSSANSRGTTG
jgi:hypothetical protein